MFHNIDIFTGPSHGNSYIFDELHNSYEFVGMAYT